jgi:hypothetical protein
VGVTGLETTGVSIEGVTGLEIVGGSIVDGVEGVVGCDVLGELIAREIFELVPVLDVSMVLEFLMVGFYSVLDDVVPTLGRCLPGSFQNFVENSS